MMPKVKSMMSMDPERPDLPRDVDDCSVAIEVEIGPADGEGADLFYFQVVTPAALAREDARWGRGLLILPSFSWEAVDRALSKLLLHAHADTWAEVAAQLNKELHWEFEGYHEA